jgi:hypothetical protein
MITQSPPGRFIQRVLDGNINMKSHAFVFAVVVIVFTGVGCRKEQKEEPIRLADKLAAHPDDPSKPAGVAGVPDAKLQSAEAIEAAVKACVEAVKADPNEPRYKFELGRVLLLGGMVEEAREQLEAAAQQRHAGAYFYLGALELETAKGFFQKASAGKFKPADTLVSDLRPIDAFQPRKAVWPWFVAAGVVLVLITILYVVQRLRRPNQVPGKAEAPPTL